MTNLIVSKDEIENFIPSDKPRLLILGTMGSICARTIDGKRPEDFFFYHNSRNHFWKVLQHLFEPELPVKSLTTPEKKAFLLKWNIAMANVVDEFLVTKDQSDDPSDKIIFNAHKIGKAKVKLIPENLKAILNATPVVFTCRPKPELQLLLHDYLRSSNLDIKLESKIHYLATPTRCNAFARSNEWRAEIESVFGKII